MADFLRRRQVQLTSKDSLHGARALVRVDGSHKIGLGHIYRMKSLGIALEQAGWELGFCSLENSIGEDLLSASGFEVYQIRKAEYVYIPASVLKKFSPDVVILDILDCDVWRLESLRALTSAKIVTFDDTKAGLTHADAVINAMVFHWKSYPKDRCLNVPVYEGPNYMVLNEEISARGFISSNTSDIALDVLITFGGSDTYNVTERILEQLNQLPICLNLRINLGSGARPSDAFDKYVSASQHRVTILRSSSSLVQEFLKSELVITSGGITQYELAALGIPSAAIATERHEIENVNYWSELGTCLNLGWEKQLDMTAAAQKVHALALSKRERQEMVKVCERLSVGTGLQNCVNILERIIQ